MALGMVCDIWPVMAHSYVDFTLHADVIKQERWMGKSAHKEFGNPNTTTQVTPKYSAFLGS